MNSEIIFIDRKIAKIRISKEIIRATNFINLNVVFVDGAKRILGEVIKIDNDILSVSLLGEFLDGNFINGIINIPKLSSSIRNINQEEMDILTSIHDKQAFALGKLPQYNNYPYMVNINELFGHHLGIFGNTGSGKSYGVARIIQTLFYDQRNLTTNSNILIFDVHGEYKTSFSNIRKFNSNFYCKDYDENRKLKIPVWLLDVNDIALLLNANDSRQLIILEKAIKLAHIFNSNDINVIRLKNHIISKAILSVMYSSKPHLQIRNEVFDILNMCNTPDISLNVNVKGLGYERNFKKCFDIGKNGSFVEEYLIISFLESFINDEIELKVKDGNEKYSLDTIEEALSFTIISDNILNNESLYSCASILQVRLHSIITSPSKEIFQFDTYITLDEYLKQLFEMENGEHAQIALVNMENYDDNIAKFISKTLSRFLFESCKKLEPRGSRPVHIVLEEAHRYVETNTDEVLFNFNIFSRIAKEGRKYGVILTIITQRPTELAENVISQCSNFILFRINHPKDIEYLKSSITNVDTEIIEKQKTIQPGNCIGFGRAFKLAMLINLDMPNPTPLSDNPKIYQNWKGDN